MLDLNKILYTRGNQVATYIGRKPNGWLVFDVQGRTFTTNGAGEGKGGATIISNQKRAPISKGEPRPSVGSLAYILYNSARRQGIQRCVIKAYTGNVADVELLDSTNRRVHVHTGLLVGSLAEVKQRVNKLVSEVHQIEAALSSRSA